MITLPNKPKIVKEEGNEAVFEIEPCYPGYGTTLGNALRRVLLSSLPGAAITGVKIKGVQHEFSTIPHVMEDVVQIILNLKQIRFKFFSREPIKVILSVKGEKKATAGDIKTTADLEVINPEAMIATLTDKKAELHMELEVEAGLGYAPVEQRKKEKLEVGQIAIDAIFGPVRKVNYNIENIRVGDRTDYDRIKVALETDGSISPRDAFLQAAKILVDHFKTFCLLGEKEKKIGKKKKITIERTSGEKPKKKAAKEDFTKVKVNEMKISARIQSALISAGVKTLAGLLRKREKDLRQMDGMGDKGIVEVKRALGKMGLTLK